jgi:uncharacterized membrane protein
MHTPAYAIEKMDCGGTEPFWSAIIDDRELVFSYDLKKKIYPLPTFEAPGGTNPDYITSVQARTINSSIKGFIVNETQTFVGAKDDNSAPTSVEYEAYCSDDMSDRRYPYSVHLFVDGTPYRGCCSSVKSSIK